MGTCQAKRKGGVLSICTNNHLPVTINNSLEKACKTHPFAGFFNFRIRHICSTTTKAIIAKP